MHNISEVKTAARDYHASCAGCGQAARWHPAWLDVHDRHAALRLDLEETGRFHWTESTTD